MIITLDGVLALLIAAYLTWRRPYWTDDDVPPDALRWDGREGWPQVEVTPEW